MVRPIQPARDNAVQRARTKAAPQAGGLWGWFSRWRSATKRAEARAAPKPTSKTKPTKKPSRRRAPDALRLDIEPLYLVRGADGLLRGAPDPTMVVCAWTMGPHGPQTVLRSVVRFDVEGKLPRAAAPDVEHLMSTAFRSGAAVLLFVALFEENRGDDVRRLAAALEHPEELHLVELCDPAPRVTTAREAFTDDALDALSVRGILLDEGGDPSRTTTDTWVGGAAVVLRHASRLDHRINLRTADGTQDWIVALTTRRR